MDINYNLYRVFVSVFETNNISKAAERLFCTPSNVSQNIKNLEIQLGVKLFNNQPNGVKPTVEAISLYDDVKPTFDTLKKAEDRIKDFNNLSSGIIRIGCPTHLSHVYANYFWEFYQSYPNIKLQIYGGVMDELFGMLTKRNIDFLIDALDAQDWKSYEYNKSISNCKLKELERVFFTTKEFAKCNNIKAVITKEQLETLPKILPLLAFEHVKRFLKEKIDFTPKSIMETTHAELMYEIILKNSGIGFCVEEYLDSRHNQEIEKLKIAYELPKIISKCLYYSNEINKACKVFLNGLKEFCGR